MPDIEGVPYETTGTPLDQASAQALAARHREAAAAGVRAEAALPGMTATTSAAQARADAAYALAEALGDNTSGGFYLDKDGRRVEYVYVVSDTDPGQSTVIDGKTYEVWWVQTAPPDPNQWVPKPVTASIEARSYTVPVDAGATYTVDGVPKPAGTYALGTTEAKSLPWAAVAKSGYSFKAGATTSGTFSFPAKEYASGDVLMSDSFNRADGSLAGTTSDSYAGGEPYAWVAERGAPAINGAKVTNPTGTQMSWPRYNLPSTQRRIAVEVAGGKRGAVDAMVALACQDGSLVRITWDGQTHFVPPVGQGNATTLYSNNGHAAGQTLRLTYDMDANKVSMYNVTLGTAVPVANPTPPLTAPVTHIYGDMRDSTTDYWDSIKVWIP